VRLRIGYSWLRIVALTDITVLNFRIWLPEGVVYWMTDRKEALSVEQRACVCVCVCVCVLCCVVCCLNWNCLFIDRQLVLHLQLRELKRMEGNSWWEYGTLQELRGNGTNRMFSCCVQLTSQCGVMIICFFFFFLNQRPAHHIVCVYSHVECHCIIGV